MPRLLTGLLIVIVPTIACAIPVLPPMDTATFVAKSTDILIVRCLNPDVVDGGKNDGLTLVEVEVIVIIKGDRKIGKTRLGTIGQPMEAGKRYLMASLGGNVFDTGFLAQSDQAVVELPPDLDLKSLAGKTVVAQAQAVFDARREQAKKLLQRLQREKKVLDSTAPKPGADKPPVAKKLDRVPDPSPDLQRELTRLDETYRHGTPEQFAEMEKRAVALAKQYTAKDDQARIWGQLAWVGGQSGIDRHTQFVRKYATKCLELSRDPLERGRMYSLLACAVDLGGFAFPKGRREAADTLLTGYRELLAQQLPELAPELPVVEKIGDVIGRGDAEEAQALARHTAQLAAREEARFIRDQIDRRDTLVRQLRDLYKPDAKRHGRTPDGPEELRALAAKRLTDTQVDLLMKKVEK
jgi:hypothetical protein